MSQEVRSADPVELTRRLYEAADRGDCDAMMGLFRPDAVWDLSEAGIGTFEGAPMLAAPHPLLLHNTGQNFPTATLRSTYKAAGASSRVRVERQALGRGPVDPGHRHR